ncbi:MAG TPA: hypothetical protein VLE73_03510 [Candidatus Saccharimonadales bacterium]|nr:hypothetical protein [Candidatus Saccharimonadales bacterium]
MPPIIQQPQQNKPVVQGEVPASPDDVVVLDAPSKKGRRLFMVLAALLVIGFLPGWLLLWQTERQAKQGTENGVNSLQTSSSAGMSCDQRLKRYENSFMGLGFCYPPDWGEVFVQDGKFEPGDSGNRWRLTFTTKEQVTIGLVSLDWSSTVPRSATCLDPAAQDMPPFVPLITAWKTEGKPIESGWRGIEARDGVYRIDEAVADLTTNGVCLTGYVQLGGVYRHAIATYYSEFSPVIVSPAHHIDHPNMLISATDRAAFAALVKSIRKL